METKEKGYFTIEQIDRMNLKTMANQLSEPWTGQDLMAFLIVCSDRGMQLGLSAKEAKQSVVDFYCTTPAEQIMEDMEVMSQTPEFQSVLQIEKMIHEDHEGFMKAIEEIEKRGGFPDELG